jgi:hypothetical protein
MLTKPCVNSTKVGKKGIVCAILSMKMNLTHRKPLRITRKGIKMGQMIDGQWDDNDERQTDRKGVFIRTSSTFRNWITPDGAPGISGDDGFTAEPGRYHLFVAPSCRWAHRRSFTENSKGSNASFQFPTRMHRR